MRRLLKKSKKTLKTIEKKASSQTEFQNGTKISKNPELDLSIKERLFSNYAEALERITLWLPLFLGAWLSSGFILEHLKELAIVSLPLLVQFLFRSRKAEIEIAMEKEVLIFTRVSPYISAVYLFSEMNRPDLSICLALASLFLEGYFIARENKSFFLIIKALSPCCFMAATAQMGILSQQKFTSLNEVFLGYSVLGFIPGTVLTARKFLLSADKFSVLGWALGSTAMGEKTKPSAYTKLVVFFIVLGPAIPAMLLPFDILPKAFISSSLVFFIVPKIADIIQNTKDPQVLKVSSIHLTLLALGLEVVVFISALIGI